MNKFQEDVMIGKEVRIIFDCRTDVGDGNVINIEEKTMTNATGQIGIYEGKFDLSDEFLNPKISYGNNEYIWGIECWWDTVGENTTTLEEAQQDVKSFIASAFSEVENESDNS